MSGVRVEGDVDAGAELAFEARCLPFLQDGRGYPDIHRDRPQTLGVAMQEDPVGQATWIIDKFHAWSDLREQADLGSVFSLDHLITNLMLYAATGSFTTATWIYRAAQHEVMRVLPPGSRIEVPTGFASFPCEIRPRPPRSLIEKTYDLRHFTEFDQGGHFAALERPEAFSTDVATFIGLVRSAR